MTRWRDTLSTLFFAVMPATTIPMNGRLLTAEMNAFLDEAEPLRPAPDIARRDDYTGIGKSD